VVGPRVREPGGTPASRAMSTSRGCDRAVPGRDRALCNAPFRLGVARETVRMWGKAGDFPPRFPSLPPPLQNPSTTNPASPPRAAPRPAFLWPRLHPRAPGQPRPRRQSCHAPRVHGRREATAAVTHHQPLALPRHPTPKHP